jgi:hypothetical protein
VTGRICALCDQTAEIGEKLCADCHERAMVIIYGGIQPCGHRSFEIYTKGSTAYCMACAREANAGMTGEQIMEREG